MTPIVVTIIIFVLAADLFLWMMAKAAGKKQPKVGE